MDPSSIPSMTGGAGGAAGPSQASGSFFNSLGGMDGSGWAVNFGQAGSASATVAAQSPSVPAALGAGYVPDQFGLPNFMTGPSTAQAAQSVGSGAVAGMASSPLLLVALVVVAVVLIRRHG